MIAGRKVKVVLCTRCLKRLKKDGKLSKISAVRITPALV
jgi:ribosomal protein L28